MAQTIIDNKHKNINFDKNEINLNLSPQKVVRLYYSKCYKSYVLSFKLGKTKKFIITKFMWKIFQRYLPKIQRVLEDGKS